MSRTAVGLPLAFAAERHRQERRLAKRSSNAPILERTQLSTPVVWRARRVGPHRIIGDWGYISLLKRRLIAYRATGHADWLKCYRCHRWAKPDDPTLKSRGRFTWHPQCETTKTRRLRGSKARPRVELFLRQPGRRAGQDAKAMRDVARLEAVQQQRNIADPGHEMSGAIRGSRRVYDRPRHGRGLDGFGGHVVGGPFPEPLTQHGVSVIVAEQELEHRLNIAGGMVILADESNRMEEGRAPGCRPQSVGTATQPTPGAGWIVSRGRRTHSEPRGGASEPMPTQ